MGYAHYTPTRNGEEIEAGYGVEAVCEQGDCKTEIDRGLYYLCGDKRDSEHGCGKYFCDKHMFIDWSGEWTGQLCGTCRDKVVRDSENEEG